MIRLLFFFGAGADGEVEVVGQQAVGVGFGDGQDVFGVEVEEVGVVSWFDEQVFAVVAAVVDVVGLAEAEWLDGHGLI